KARGTSLEDGNGETKLVFEALPALHRQRAAELLGQALNEDEAETLGFRRVEARGEPDAVVLEAVDVGGGSLCARRTFARRFLASHSDRDPARVPCRESVL